MVITGCITVSLTGLRITGGLGSGINIRGGQSVLLHNTIARNSGSDGSGIHVVSWDSVASTVSPSNTILVTLSIGITVAAGSTATLESALWGSGEWANETD